MKYAIIALGSDRVNIELAKKIIEVYKKKKINSIIKLIIHIQNKDIDILFHQEFMLADTDQDKLKKLNIEIKTFSFFDEAAIKLFENHSIDGDNDTYINSDKSFNSIVIGNGDLVNSVIYQMGLISHLPNENLHTVFIVDEFADKLLIDIKKQIHYKNKNNPSFKLKAVNLNRNSLAFFKDKIWAKEDLVNVIIAYDAEVENLNLALELFNRTYLSKALTQNMPKIIFAIYDQSLLSDIFNNNLKSFKHFYTFGNSENVLKYNSLIVEKNNLLAKLIHLGYGDQYMPNKLNHYKANKEENKSWIKRFLRIFHKVELVEDQIDKKWFNTAKYSDKLSSLAQAKHIDIKLKAMGFYKIPSIKNKKELLKSNREKISKVFKDERESLNINDQQLEVYSKELEKLYNNKSYTIKYFPKSYNSLFEKMIRMEHNRWSAYHYLNGWKYSKNTIKGKKEHDCLKPLQDFKQDRLKITVIYDIYSFLYLPNYLAEAGYEIVPLKTV